VLRPATPSKAPDKVALAALAIVVLYIDTARSARTFIEATQSPISFYGDGSALGDRVASQLRHSSPFFAPDSGAGDSADGRAASITKM
jgi:hypothetical protein